jgi:tetratricopeptide (TPR) repeat protein
MKFCLLIFSVLFQAYMHEDMSVWKAHIDTVSDLSIEYGYCAAVMAEDKSAATPYVHRFREHVEAQRAALPVGHYEMYMSAVYVYELRLHESFHPARSLSLARKAVELAPDDPLTLTYCGTALFYAPPPFGSKKEALELFLRAEKLFDKEEWYECWWRPAALMYIAQCYDKQGNYAEAIRYAQALLKEYPEYRYIRDTFLPQVEAKASSQAQ